MYSKNDAKVVLFVLIYNQKNEFAWYLFEVHCVSLCVFKESRNDESRIM